MLSEMDEIYQSYRITSEVFSQHQELIFEKIKLSKYPNTLAAQFFFIRKIDLLLEGIVNATESFYVSQILTRTILEHYLSCHYIWTKFRIEKTDDTGIAYYQAYRLSEFIKVQTYNLKLELNVKNVPEEKRIERLRSSHPELKSITSKGVQRLHTKAKQFDIKNINDYLTNQIPSNDPFVEAHKSIPVVLRMYNRLSSFIHGGPEAENKSFDDPNMFELDMNCHENRDWGLIASQQSKYNMIHSLTLEFEEFVGIYLKLQKKVT